jgi:hypothetical protein
MNQRIRWAVLRISSIILLLFVWITALSSYNTVSGNNITVKDVAPVNDSPGNDELLALGLGLGLALGIPFLIGFGIILGYFLSRCSRDGRKLFTLVPRLRKTIPRLEIFIP